MQHRPCLKRPAGYSPHWQEYVLPAANGQAESLKYTPQGELWQMGNTEFKYTPSGALAARFTDSWYGMGGKHFYFEYGDDTRLDAVTLPDGTRITYTYAQGDGPSHQVPLCKYINGELAAEYIWKDMLRLKECRDYMQGLSFNFKYPSSGLLSPERVVITPFTRTTV